MITGFADLRHDGNLECASRRPGSEADCRLPGAAGQNLAMTVAGGGPGRIRRCDLGRVARFGRVLGRTRGVDDRRIHNGAAAITLCLQVRGAFREDARAQFRGFEQGGGSCRRWSRRAPPRVPESRPTKRHIAGESQSNARRSLTPVARARTLLRFVPSPDRPCRRIAR